MSNKIDKRLKLVFGDAITEIIILPTGKCRHESVGIEEEVGVLRSNVLHRYSMLCREENYGTPDDGLMDDKWYKGDGKQFALEITDVAYTAIATEEGNILLDVLVDIIRGRIDKSEIMASRMYKTLEFAMQTSVSVASFIKPFDYNNTEKHSIARNRRIIRKEMLYLYIEMEIYNIVNNMQHPKTQAQFTSSLSTVLATLNGNKDNALFLSTMWVATKPATPSRKVTVIERYVDGLTRVMNSDHFYKRLRYIKDTKLVELVHSCAGGAIETTIAESGRDINNEASRIIMENADLKVDDKVSPTERKSMWKRFKDKIKEPKVVTKMKTEIEKKKERGRNIELLEIAREIELLEGDAMDMRYKYEKDLVVERLHDKRVDLMDLKAESKDNADRLDNIEALENQIKGLLTYVKGRDLQYEKRTVRIKIDPSMTDDIKRQRVQEAAKPKAISSEGAILIRNGDKVLVIEDEDTLGYKLPRSDDTTVSGIWSRLRVRVKNVQKDGSLGVVCDLATIQGELTTKGMKFVAKLEAEKKSKDKNDRLMIRRN